MKRRWKKFLAGVLSAALALNLAAPLALAGSSTIGAACSVTSVFLYQQIYTWVQKYKKDGEEGLKDRRGRHKKDYKPQTEEERLKLEVATLKRQLYLSQMKIDVLKKLQELERGNC